MITVNNAVKFSDRKHPNDMELKGLSTDVKPTEVNGNRVGVNSIFLELDTNDFYYFDGEEWQKVVIEGGGSGEYDRDIAEIRNELKKRVYYFDNVASMKSSRDLKGGEYVVTKGYYEKNDGGGASYLIRAKTEEDVDDGGSVHFIGNSLVAELIVENNTINVKQFGAYGDSTHNDTNTIQNCIDKFNNIFLPKGTYFVSSLNLKSKLTIRGEGKNNSIILGNSINDIILNGNFDSSGYEEIIIKDLCIDGNNKSDYGIKFLRTENSQHDTWCNIINLKIQRCLQSGLYLGSYIREVYANTLEVVSCKGNGVTIESGATDNVLSNIVSHNNELYGFYINGAGNRFEDCKAFWNGRNSNATQENRKSGFYISTYHNKFVNCDAQENALNGFDIINTNTIILDACTADRNGLPMTDWSSSSPSETYGIGINVVGSDRITINSMVRDFRKYTAGQTQKYGLYISNSNYLSINLISQHQEIDYLLSSVTHCNFTLNGDKIQNGEYIKSKYDPSNNYLRCVSENALFGYDIYENNSRFSFNSNTDDTFQVDSYEKVDGVFTWRSTPIKLKKDGSITVQSGSNKKLAFYGATPITRPSVNGYASDLASTISLVNDLKIALRNLGLITDTN